MTGRDICLIAFLLFAVALFEAVLCVAYSKLKRPLFAKFCGALLFAVCLAMLFLTVFSRDLGVRTGIRITPFWSYAKAFRGLKKGGSSVYLKEIVLNIILFVPLGMILPYLTEKTGSKKYPVFLFAGLAFSLLIEILQYVLKLGVFDMDDLIDNSLGCMIGILISACCKKRVHHGTNTDLEV